MIANPCVSLVNCDPPVTGLLPSVNMTTLDQILQYISTAPVNELKAIIHSAQNELPKRAEQAKEFTSYMEDFCANDTLLENIREELDSLDLSTKATKAPTQWLSDSGKPYIYPDTNFHHKAISISNFPNITKLMDLVNESSEVTGPLDSCLVTKYNSDRASLRIHDDGEANMIDQTKAICSFTIGAERTIEFWSHGQKPLLVSSYRMKHNSLVVMRPGTQQHLRHGVRAERNTGKPDTTYVRYSLSFRAISKPAAPVVSKTAGVQADSVIVQPDPVELHTPPVERKYVSLVAGDSYAARLNADLLGKKKITVENIAKGGAKMSDVMKQLEDYKTANPNNVVNKIIISVGTNDIRNNRINNSQFKGQFKVLCKFVGELFPDSVIFFQTLLPLPLSHDKDFSTNRRIDDINRMIYHSCRFYQFYLVNAFHQFLKFNRKFKEPIQRFDKLFENGGIHPNTSSGMGVLARLYIGALHRYRRNFNPLIPQ